MKKAIEIASNNTDGLHISYDADIIDRRNNGTEYVVNADKLIQTSISALSAAISLADWNGVPSDIKEERDSLAERLGK